MLLLSPEALEALNEIFKGESINNWDCQNKEDVARRELMGITISYKGLTATKGDWMTLMKILQRKSLRAK